MELCSRSNETVTKRKSVPYKIINSTQVNYNCTYGTGLSTFLQWLYDENTEDVMKQHSFVGMTSYKGSKIAREIHIQSYPCMGEHWRHHITYDVIMSINRTRSSTIVITNRAQHTPVASFSSGTSHWISLNNCHIIFIRIIKEPPRYKWRCRWQYLHE